MCCSGDCFLGLIALLFPPLPVWVKRGIFSADSLINILLCCLGILPGLFHAWYIIAKYPEPPYEYVLLNVDREGGPQPHGYIHSQPPQQPQPNSQGPHDGNMNYGTQGASSSNQEQGVTSGGAPPPTYAQVVGDNKVQPRE